MVNVVGVRFKRAGKVYYFDPGDYEIIIGTKVVVETARGVEYGEVAVGPKLVPEDQVVQPLKKVIRPGTDKDATVAAENKRKEKEAFVIAQKKIEGHSLEMNLVDVEYTFDGSKNIFYFTAEGRVDFRELVRDLASIFRTRIEMRQIGVRDEAKLLGGIGPCGRILCCTSFLGDFAPVSIRMAKDQNLSLNPSKISGLCGRLMCCLRYEQETYESAKKDPTLAPGYVPPAILADSNEAILDEFDDQRPRIGLQAGLSARIAQASGIPAPNRPPRREPDSRPRVEGNQDRPGSPPKAQVAGVVQQGQSHRKGNLGQPQGQRPQGQVQGRPQQGSTPGPRPQAGGQTQRSQDENQPGERRDQNRNRRRHRGGGEKQSPGEATQQ